MVLRLRVPGPSPSRRRGGGSPRRGYIVARVSGRSPVLPGIVIVGEAVSAVEPGPG